MAIAVFNRVCCPVCWLQGGSGPQALRDAASLSKLMLEVCGVLYGGSAWQGRG